LVPRGSFGADGRRGGDGRLIADAYTRKARLAPAALAAAPAIAAAAGALGSIEQAGGIVVFVLSAALIVVCGLVRGLGRGLEPSLWAGWGGAPTIERLRWSGQTPEVIQRRRHELLARITGESLPTEREEAADPVAADQRYDLAVSVLRDRTRDGTRFKLVAEENAEYGFRRYCLGLRPLAVAIALVVMVVGVVFVAKGSTAFIASIGVSLAALVFWLSVVRAGWVRSAADRYAVRLLETVETLSRES
jgi:hypothetical protein